MTTQPTRSYGGYDFSLTERIIGACIEVHRALGPGFQEVIYQRALELELASAGLEFAREVDVPMLTSFRHSAFKCHDRNLPFP